MKRDESKNLELYSPEVFQLLMDYEISRSQRYPAPLTLLNMTAVPGEQNPVIRQAMDAVVPSIINSHLRAADIPSKKNDQYLILLPLTNESGGRAVCERLLSLFKGLIHTETGLTFSLAVYIGVSSHLGGAGISGEILIQQAAAALKHARSQGIPTYSVYSDIQKSTHP
jgi:hypothetical protein